MLSFNKKPNWQSNPGMIRSLLTRFTNDVDYRREQAFRYRKLTPEEARSAFFNSAGDKEAGDRILARKDTGRLEDYL